MIKLSAAAIALAVGMAGQALAAGLSPEDIIHRHVDAGNRADAAAMAADYAEDAVVLQPGQATQGRDAIQTLFGRIFSPNAAQKVTITPIKIWSQGDVGFISWEANGGAIKGQDSFLVRDGKIMVQAVFIGGGPPPAQR
jgi:uncharacterized protein (TIGR02246 family)